MELFPRDSSVSLDIAAAFNLDQESQTQVETTERLELQIELM